MTLRPLKAWVLSQTSYASKSHWSSCTSSQLHVAIGAVELSRTLENICCLVAGYHWCTVHAGLSSAVPSR